MLAKRLAIAVLLSKGYDYQSIREVLKVTPSTIANVQGWLRVQGEGYRIALKKIKKLKLKETIVAELEESLSFSNMPARYGSARFKKRSQKGKEFYKKRLNRSLL